MSSHIEAYEINSSRDARTGQMVSNLDESSIHFDQFQERSRNKTKYHHRSSNAPQSVEQGSSSVTNLVTHHPFIELRMPNNHSEDNFNSIYGTNSVQAKIIGSSEDKYTRNIMRAEYRELFKTYNLVFDANDTVGQVITKQFVYIPRGMKIHLTVCVLYENKVLGENQLLAQVPVQKNRILYILLIPTNVSKSAPQSEKDNTELKFFESTKFSESLNALVRISGNDKHGKIKPKVVYIDQIKKYSEKKRLKERALERAEIDGQFSYQFYYYGCILNQDNLFRLVHDLEIFKEREKLPIIIDLVLSPAKERITTSSQRLSLSLFKGDTEDNHSTDLILNQIGSKCKYPRNNLNDNDDNGDDHNDRDNDLSNNVQFYENFALIFYARLCLYVAMKKQDNQKYVTVGKLVQSLARSFHHEPERNDDEFLEVFHKLYLFCDKDKSSQLDEHECKIGLLMLFKYLNEDNQNDNLGVDNLLSIVYHQNQETKILSYTKKDFNTLIIDTLTEYIRIKMFQGPEYLPQKDNTDSFFDEIKNISTGLKRIIDEHLNIDDEEKSKSPFAFWQVIACIILYPLSIPIFPIIVFISLIYLFIKKQHSSRHPFNFVTYFKMGLLILSCTILAFIAYLIITNLILFHLYYKDNSNWRVNALEVYWPFALIICMYTIYYSYGFEIIALNKNHRKQEKIKEMYDRAELEYLKDVAQIITADGKVMTKAQYDFLSKQNSLNEKESKDKNNLLKNIKNFFTNLYKNEIKKQKRCVKGVTIFVLFVTLALAVLHACVPVIHRTHFSNKTDPTNTTKPFQIELIKISYFVLGIPLYLIYLLMILYAYHKYRILYIIINKKLRQITNDNEYLASTKIPYYLNLKNPYNLDYFLALIREKYRINKTNEYKFAFRTMYGAVIFDAILIFVSFVRLIMYGPGGLQSLTSAYALIDMIILSILIVIFLLGISAINTLTTTDVLEILLRTKKEAINTGDRRVKTDIHWDIAYLSANSEYLAENKKKYAITLFGQVVDNGLITGVVLTIIGGIGSSLISMVQKNLTGED